jgi:hypothetical protein
LGVLTFNVRGSELLHPGECKAETVGKRHAGFPAKFTASTGDVRNDVGNLLRARRAFGANGLRGRQEKVHQRDYVADSP